MGFLFQDLYESPGLMIERDFQVLARGSRTGSVYSNGVLIVIRSSGISAEVESSVQPNITPHTKVPDTVILRGIIQVRV